MKAERDTPVTSYSRPKFDYLANAEIEDARLSRSEPAQAGVATKLPPGAGLLLALVLSLALWAAIWGAVSSLAVVWLR